MASLGDPLDRFDLEFFGIFMAPPIGASNLRLEGVSYSRGDSLRAGQRPEAVMSLVQSARMKGHDP
jgi:hypothetical protein